MYCVKKCDCQYKLTFTRVYDVSMDFVHGKHSRRPPPVGIGIRLNFVT